MNTKLKFEIPFNLDPKFINCRNSRENTPVYLKYNHA